MDQSTPLSTWDDLALMYAVQRSDERALAVLYDRHGASILGLVIRMLPNQADAESVLLATFTQAWWNAGQYSVRRGSVAAWLVTIARSRALDAIRAAGRRARIMPISTDDVPIRSLAVVGKMFV